MNLKKLLMSVTGTALVVQKTLSVVACNEPIQLKNIDTVITKKQLQEITVPSSDKSNKSTPEEVLTAIDRVNKISLSTKDTTITVKDNSNAIIKGIGVTMMELLT